jgi:hypothetical protein
VDGDRHGGSRRQRWLRTPGHLLSGFALPALFVHPGVTFARVAANVAAVSTIGLLLASAGTAPPITMESPANPSSNIAPNPNFLESGQCTDNGGVWTCVNPCVGADLTWPAYTGDPNCSAYVLESINNARTQENLTPMILPSNWGTLTIPQQMLVVTDLERVARGYPPYLGLNANLNRAAATAAVQAGDPQLASGFAVGFNALGGTAYGGSWSAGFNVLAADYEMMYDDGWGGTHGTSNVVCTSPTSLGCWAHRDELLGSDPQFNPGVGLWCHTCEFGAAYALTLGTSSYTQLIELPARTPPSMVFTWQSELAYFPTGAIGSVKTVSLTKVAFKGSSLMARWSVTGVQNASLAAIYTFSGPSCAQIGSVASFRYVPVFNIRAGTVTMSGAGNFSRHGQYSAVVRVFTPNDSLTSRCVALGHN